MSTPPAPDDAGIWSLDLTGGTNNRPLRDGKLSVYEGGIRVPAVMRWPGKLTPGSKNNQVLSALDLFPTLAAAAGGKPGNSKPLDGENLWPQIAGGSTRRRGSLFFASKRNETPDYQFAVRRGEWKLVRRVFESKVNAEELYNVEQDVGEATDLASKQPGLAKELSHAIDEWQALHPRCDVDSSIKPHPGWMVPDDYAKAAL